MPEFSNPFQGNRCDRKLSPSEVIRAVRFNIAAEYEANQMYMQLAESTDNELVQMVLKDIADEELEHVGELLRVLKEISPTDFDFYKEGGEEVEAMMKKLAAKK